MARENPVCPLITCPCVRSKRPRVYRHHAHMCFNMSACAGVHGDVLNAPHGDVQDGHTETFRTDTRRGGEGHLQFCLPKFAHVGLSHVL